GGLRGGMAAAAGRLGLAGAVPVAVDGDAAPGDLPGHGVVAGTSGADRCGDRPDGAGKGQVTGPDREPGPAALPRAGRGERGVAGDAAGHLDGGGPGCEFLPDEIRG